MVFFDVKITACEFECRVASEELPERLRTILGMTDSDAEDLLIQGDLDRMSSVQPPRLLEAEIWFRDNCTGFRVSEALCEAVYQEWLKNHAGTNKEEAV